MEWFNLIPSCSLSVTFDKLYAALLPGHPWFIQPRIILTHYCIFRMNPTTVPAWNRPPFRFETDQYSAGNSTSVPEWNRPTGSYLSRHGTMPCLAWLTLFWIDRYTMPARLIWRVNQWGRRGQPLTGKMGYDWPCHCWWNASWINLNLHWLNWPHT